MSLCDKCISGVRHEGAPKGNIEVINGVRTYVATPAAAYSKGKAILFLSDVFGIELLNAQLLADDFARNGFQVYAVDYLNGDPIPADALNPGGNFDVVAWFGKHSQKDGRPSLDKVIKGLNERGITQFAATSYCFGGRYVFDLAFDKVIKVAAVAHPSLLKVPQDLENFKKSEIPLLINSCTDDPQFPIKSQALADEILGGGSTKSELYQREYFEGCTHGFAVRGDVSDPKVKAAKEDAFKATVEFFLKHL